MDLSVAAEGHSILGGKQRSDALHNVVGGADAQEELEDRVLPATGGTPMAGWPRVGAMVERGSLG